MQPRRFIALAFGVWLALAAALAIAHPGGLDQDGCHNDRSAGERHCHPKSLTAERLSTCELKKPPRPGDEGVFFGPFVRVIDGDTFQARVQGVVMDFRLAEVDAPESGQPYGDTARTQLLSLLRDQQLVLVPIETDRRGRTVAFVWRDALCVNRELVRRGAAWFYDEYSHSDALYHVEERARAEKVGLWALPPEQRIEPQRWRKEAR